MANPNPSPATRIKPGEVRNPGGKTSEHLKAERKAAEISALLRVAALSALKERVERGELDPLDAISGELLRLYKDSEDRAHGTPKQSVEHGGENGGPIIFKTVYEGSGDGTE